MLPYPHLLAYTCLHLLITYLYLCYLRTCVKYKNNYLSIFSTENNYLEAATVGVL